MHCWLIMRVQRQQASSWPHFATSCTAAPADSAGLMNCRLPRRCTKRTMVTWMLLGAAALAVCLEARPPTRELHVPCGGVAVFSLAASW